MPTPIKMVGHIPWKLSRRLGPQLTQAFNEAIDAHPELVQAFRDGHAGEAKYDFAVDAGVWTAGFKEEE